MKKDVINPENLTYFYNKILDKTLETKGIECVLREKNTDGEWVLPNNFDKIPFVILTQQLVANLKLVDSDQLIVITKVTLEQLLSRFFKDNIKTFSEAISPFQLVIEISHNEIIKKQKINAVYRRIRLCHKYGIQCSLNNLGAKFYHARNIHKLLPLIDILKLDLKEFKNKDEWLDLTMTFWTKLANKYNKTLIVSGVETLEDEQLINQLKIDLRQGYYYSNTQKSLAASQIK